MGCRARLEGESPDFSSLILKHASNWKLQGTGAWLAGGFTQLLRDPEIRATTSALVTCTTHHRLRRFHPSPPPPSHLFFRRASLALLAIIASGLPPSPTYTSPGAVIVLHTSRGCKPPVYHLSDPFHPSTGRLVFHHRPCGPVNAKPVHCRRVATWISHWLLLEQSYTAKPTTANFPPRSLFGLQVQQH